MDRCRTQCSSRMHHIQSTLDPEIHRLLTSRRLRTQPVIQQPRLIHQHHSRRTTRAAHTSRPQLPLSVTSRMSRMSTTTTRPGLWLARLTGPEVHSQTRRFVTPSSERFADVLCVRGLSFRDTGYMRTCDRICHRIFCKNPHIAYFTAYNGIFEISNIYLCIYNIYLCINYAKFCIFPHM